MSTICLVAGLFVACATAPAELPTRPEPEPQPAVALPDDLVVEIVGTGGLSPWRRIRYAVEQINGQPMLVHGREYHGHDHGFTDRQPPRRSLLDADAWATLHDALERCRLGALEATSPPPVDELPAERVWRVRWGRAGAVPAARHTVWLEDEAMLAWPCLAVIEETVAEQTDPIVYERIFVAEAELGLLDIVTVPVADIHIDGIDLERSTPVWQVPLPAGEHEIRLVSEEEGLDRRYEIVIEVGQTTILDFDLRN